MATPYNEERENIAPDRINQMSFKQKVNPQNYLNNKVLTGSRVIGGGLSNIQYSNLMLYDAVVDAGGNGDFTSIQKAIDDGRTRIFVRAGTYVLDSTITLEDNLEIVGESNEETVLKLDDDLGADTNIFTISGKSYIRVYNIYFDGNRANNTNNHTGVNISSSSDDIKVNNCNFYNFGSRAINIDDECEDVQVVNSYFRNNQSQIRIKNNPSGGTIVASNFMEGISSATVGIGIEMENVGDCLIANNTITLSQPLIKVSGNCRYNLIVNNNFYQLRENSIYIIDSASSQPKHNIISNNVIRVEGNSEDSFLIEGGFENIIQGNTMRSNGAFKTNDTYAFIMLGSNNNNSTYNTISNNIIKETSNVGSNDAKYGIREDSSSEDYNLIHGNIVQGAVTANISTQGSNTVSNDNIS